jgi:hypothetical protein
MFYQYIGAASNSVISVVPAFQAFRLSGLPGFEVIPAFGSSQFRFPVIPFS